MPEGITSRTSIWGLIWLGTVSNAMLILMPELVGALVVEGHASTSQSGMLAALQLTGAAIGGGLVLLAGNRLSTSRQTGIAAALIAICFAGCTLPSGVNLLALMWFATGCACGFGSTTVFRLVALHSRPSQLYGVILVAQALFGFAGFMAMHPLLSAFGMDGIFFILALLVLVGAPLLFRLPNFTPSGRPEDSRFVRIGRGPALVALSLLAHYIANSLLWSFAERIGAVGGLDSATISTALALSMIAGLAGAICATFWASHFSSRWGIYVGIVLIIAANLLLFGQTAALFATAVGIMNFSILFVVPAYLGYLADSPDGQDAATVGTLCIAIGLAGGPALGSAMITTSEFQPALAGCLGLFGLALLLAFIGVRIDRGRRTLSA